MAETIYSSEQISSWQSEMKSFAQTPRTQFTKKQAVAALIQEIEASLENHPYSEVADKLRKLGLDISKGLLKQYVNTYRREHGTQENQAHHKRSSRASNQKKEGVTQPQKQKKEMTVTKNVSASESSNIQPVAAGGLQQRKSNSRFIDMPEDL